MAKLPWTKWFFTDWMSDPALSKCKPATRGIWMDALGAMHMSDCCGELSGTLEELSRVCRCSVGEMTVAKNDLKATGTADVTDCNGKITIRNRRMYRDFLDRKSSAERKKRFDDRKRNGESNGDVTPESQKSEVRSQRRKKSRVRGEVPLPEIPESLRTSEFTVVWGEWIAYRRERRPAVSAAAARAQFFKLERWGVQKAIEAIQNSIANSWQGLFEPEVKHAGRKSPNSRTAVDRGEYQSNLPVGTQVLGSDENNT